MSVHLDFWSYVPLSTYFAFVKLKYMYMYMVPIQFSGQKKYPS